MIFGGKKSENFGKKRTRLGKEERAPFCVRTLIDSSRVSFHLGYYTMSRAAIVATFRAGGLLDERSPLNHLFTSPYTLSLLLPPPVLCCAYLWLLSRLPFCFFVLLGGFSSLQVFNFRSCRFVRERVCSVCERLQSMRARWICFPSRYRAPGSTICDSPCRCALLFLSLCRRADFLISWASLGFVRIVRATLVQFVNRWRIRFRAIL